MKSSITASQACDSRRAARRVHARPCSTVVALALALALASCASLSSQEKSSYAQAQAEVQKLEAEPLANQAAGDSLREARSALANATEAERHHDGNDLTYWSYMATRHAQVGEAMVAELRARNQMAQANAERNRVLLEHQQRRAELAEQQAQQAGQQAQQATEQARSAQAQLEQQRQQAQLARQQQQSQQQIAQAQREAEAARQALQRQQQQSQQQLAQARRESEQAQQAEKQSRQQLEQLQAKQTAQGLVLTLSGPLLFRTGSSTLEPGATHSLGNVASVLRQHPMMKVRIEGFTDARGSDQLNQDLSHRRAEAVANALKSDGVDPSRLVVIGLGKSLPIASNTTAAGRQQNRRVALVFSDTQGRFASNQPQEHLR